jgi:peptide/nickel transport system substrate-binding protein
MVARLGRKSRPLAWWIALASLGLATALGAVASAQQKAPDGPPAGPVGKVVVALAPQTTATVDPALASGASDYANLEVLYNRLLEPYPDRSELGPGIATKWTVSADGKTAEFKIRSGVKFHNGDVLTPEDVVFTYQRVQRLGQPIAKAPLERFLESVEAKGDSVIFHLKEADWKFVNEFTKPYYSIVPKKYIERVGDDGFLKAPVGTGPFRFVGWSKQEFLEVEAVEGEHFLRKPGVKRLRYVIIPEETTRLAMVKTGEADLGQVSVTSLPAVQADPKIKLIKVPSTGGLRIFLFGQADAKNPFSKLEVRQALSLAIDREAIAQRIYHGYARPVAVATQNPIQANFPGWGKQSPPYDLERAKQLLAKAGYPGGSGLRFTFHNYEYAVLPLWTQVAPVIASSWEKLGIQVTLRQWEWGSYAPLARTGKFEPLAVSTHIANLGSPWDPAGFMTDFTRSGIYRVPAGIADGAYPALKELAEQYDRELNPARRAGLHERILAYDRDNVIFIPVITQDGLFAAGPRVLAYTPMPGTIFTGNMYTIRVKP